MAEDGRKMTFLALGRGLMVALGVTLAGMVLLAALIVFVTLSDSALLTINQLIKLVSIFLGARAAVGIGGKRGFALGASVGLMYMVAGYALYCLLDGEIPGAALMAGEFALGAGIGALSGAIIANLKPGKKRTLRSKRA